MNYVPELSVHLLGLERGLEALEELHHLGVHLEVGEVVVHPQQQHARHAVEDLLAARAPLQQLLGHLQARLDEDAVREQVVLDVGGVGRAGVLVDELREE